MFVSIFCCRRAALLLKEEEPKPVDRAGVEAVAAAAAKAKEAADDAKDGEPFRCCFCFCHLCATCLQRSFFFLLFGCSGGDGVVDCCR